MLQLYCAAPQSSIKVTLCLQGLIDAHVHILWGGASLQWINLKECTERAQVAAKVKQAAGTHVQSTAACNAWVRSSGAGSAVLRHGLAHQSVEPARVSRSRTIPCWQQPLLAPCRPGTARGLAARLWLG